MPKIKEFNLEMLVIAPHPDDAEIFCGGLIIKMTRRGYRVGVVDMSRAELSTYGTVETRQAETERASQVLGLSWRSNLGLPNCLFHEYSDFGNEKLQQNAAVQALVKAIRATKPEIVVAPFPNDRHPDHVQAGCLTERALFMAGLVKYQEVDLPAFSPTMVIQYQFRAHSPPSFIVDISEEVEGKFKAINCYSSQLHAQDGIPQTLLTSPLSLGAFRARDSYYGSLIGVAFGEGYFSKTSLRIDDLLQHSRSNPTSEALFFLERNA